MNFNTKPLEAIIYKSTGSWYTARDETGHFIKCRLAGKLKLDQDISSTNPVAVGDKVVLQPEKGQDTAVIISVEKRENYIVRASPHQHVQRHILAANIDQAVLLATLRNPVTSKGFVDRFLVTAAAYHIPAILVFNKTDIYREKEWQQLETIHKVYRAMDYTVLEISAVAESEQASELRSILKDRMTLLAGHSGVGKSTLINKLIPGQNIKTQDVSGWSGKGLHTTTFAEMMTLPFGGRLIDTPGVREWGIVDIEKTELSHYFLDMRPYISQCKFNNCLHLNEPGCAVKEAVVKEEIALLRFNSYLSILDSMK